MALENVSLNNVFYYDKYVDGHIENISNRKLFWLGSISRSRPIKYIIVSNLKNVTSAITSLNPGGADQVLNDEFPVRWNAAVCLRLSGTEVSPDWPTVTELQQMAGASEETRGRGAATLVHFYCWTNVSFIFPYFSQCIQWLIWLISLSWL